MIQLRQLWLKIVKKLYPRIGLRSSDVLLASFPKSGNTWFRFIWANIVSVRELGGKEVDFHLLNTELNAVYDTVSYGELTFQCLPRLVKTHSEYDERAFSRNRSIYLYRHPGDVLISYHHYLSARKDGGISGQSLSEFIRNERYGLPAWCRHVQSWIDESEVAITYRQLKKDAVGATERVLARLGLTEPPEPVIEEAVERSSFSRLRELEEDRSRPRSDDFSSGYRFVRSGSVGEWHDQFTAADVDYLRSTVVQAGLEDALVEL